MKNFFQSAAWALLAICITSNAIAQKEDKEKAKNKLGEYDEIIIKKKGDKGGKVTVEIKDNEVLVNGKPLSEYDDDNISVRKNKMTVWNGNARTLVSPASPFRSMNVFPGEDRAFLGVVTEKNEKGAEITSVTDGSAAEKAGLKEGDVIVRIDDTKIENQEQLSKAITKHKPEEKVTVVYLRNDKEQKAVVPLGKQNWGGTFTMPRVSANPNFNFDYNDGMGQVFAYAGRPRIGIKAQDTEDGKGVKVLEVSDESVADKAGIKEGDVITEFDGKQINSADELSNAAHESREKALIVIKYNRDGKSQTAEIKIPKKLKTTNL